MANSLILDPVDRFLWSIVIAILFMCAGLYFYRGYGQENKNEKIIMYGFASIFIGLAIGRIFFYMCDFQIKGTYINHAYYGDFNEYHPILELFVKLAFISSFTGITIFIFCFEYTIKRTRYILTLMNSILIISIVISPFELATFITNYIAIFVNFLVFFLILIYFTKYSKKEFKAVSSFMIFGGILIIFGTALYGDVAKASMIIPLYFAPILFIIGALISVLPTLLNPKYFTRASLFWMIFFVFGFGIFFVLLYYTISFGMPTFWIIGLIFYFCVYLIFLLYYLKNIFKPKNIEENSQMKNILSIFIKPQKIPKEEITLYQEKKICLVCKGKVARFNVFICPNCDVLYCENCAHSLSNLENACWVCETAFDELKPVKIAEKEKDIKIEEEVHKNR